MDALHDNHRPVHVYVCVCWWSYRPVSCSLTQINYLLSYHWPGTVYKSKLLIPALVVQ